ncbi:MAG TPA: hypothetical protein VEX70_13665, partial [Pyrinomonadaceae bacterium]|nr:hypothetical protein [Pyrinomonadaceae bacterium]
LMFGGSSASVPGLVPSDIEVRGNHLSKPLAWREGEPEYAGVRWEVKNLFELKSARRVVVEGNLFEYSWRDAQVGFAILLTPLDQNGTAPWAVVEDVLITNNIIRHAASGIQIKLYVSPARRITIRNNLFEDIDGRKWCGTDCSSGHFLEVEGAEQLTVEHNTVLHTGNVLSANGRPSTGFSFSNNLAAHNAYGIFGSGQLPGTGTLATYFPNAVLSRNVIASANSNYYPANNYYPGQLDDVLFVSRANGNYRLADNSPYKNAGTDGKDVGCDFAALNAAMGNTSPSTTPTPTPTPMPTPAPPNPTPTPISNTPAPGVLQDVIWTSLLNANAAGGGSISHNGAGYFAKGQSQQTLSGAGYFEWRHNGVYCTVGFGNNNDESPSANHTDLEFTLHSDATSYSVREFGTYRSHGPLAAGDVLRIEVSATGDILYKKNGTTVHSTSNPAKAYPYYLVFKTQETVGNGITSAKVVSLTPAPIPTPIPTPTPVTGQPVSHGMVAAAHTLATALGAASSVSSAEIESLERKIEPAYAAYLLEAKQFASTERIDSALRVSLYFARAAKALSAAGAGSASVQNRLQIAASRLGQALNFMHPAMPGAQGENAHAPAANTMPFVGAANTYSSAAMSPLLSPLSLGTITGDAARSPLALTSVLADQGGNKPLLYELAGASVSINGQAAPLLYVSPSRISFLVPRGLPQGEWEVLVTSQDGYVSRGTVVVNAVVPALFTADGSGAGQALSMNNSEPGAIHYDVTSPHALGADKRTRVTLFATGIGVGASNTDFANDVRMGHGGTMANVAESLTVEARTGDGRLYHLPVEFAGALEGRVPGLDQVNVVLYPELRGAGSVDLTIIINGRRSNTASINVR